MKKTIQQIKLVLTYLLKIVAIFSPKLRKWIDAKVIEINNRLDWLKSEFE